MGDILIFIAANSQRGSARARARGICILFLLLTLGGLRLAAQTKDPASIKIGILADLDSLPLVIADKRGFFAQEGLKAELVRFPSAQNRDAALQAGKIDIAVSDLLAASFSINSDFPVCVIMASQGAYRLMTAPRSRAVFITDLKRRRIGISKNTIIEYVLDRMLAAAAMTDRDIVKEIIPQMPLRLELLKAGKLDAAVLPEPLATSALLEGSTRIDSSENMGVNPGVILTPRQTALSQTEAIAAFRRAYDKAASYLNSAPRKDYIDDLISGAGLPPALAGSLLLPTYSPWSPVSRLETEAVVAWLKKNGLITRELSHEDFLIPNSLP